MIENNVVSELLEYTCTLYNLRLLDETGEQAMYDIMCRNHLSFQTQSDTI